MKKKVYSEAIINKMIALKKSVMNTLSGDAAQLRDDLVALFDELASREEEFDINQFKSEIETIVAKYSDVPEATADAIAKAVARIENRLSSAVKQEMSPAAKNALAAAILKAHDKVDAINKAKEAAVANGISGLSFEAVVDYVVDWKIEDLNPLFSKLHRTLIEKFFYGEIDLTQAAQIAHGWNKANDYEKLVQELTVSAKTIVTDYVYKRQQVAFVDLDKIEEAGQLSQFLAMISKELDLMIVNACVIALLIGDQVNTGNNKVVTFETIGTKTTSDLFTTVVKNDDADLAAYFTTIGASSAPAVSQRLAVLRYVRDKIHNPQGKEVVAVMSRGVLSSLSPRVVAAGGDFVFRTKEEIAAELGVDDIYLTDVMPADMDQHAGAANVPVIFMIPDGYWYKEAKSIDVAYPKYENNVQNLQKERNIGGKIHDLLSTAIYYIKAGE